jgi:hypothetical protein
VLDVVIPKWQKKRSAFNHDWLKNQYMPALAKCINLIDGKIEDREFEWNFYFHVLQQWEHHEVELLSLLKDFELEMTPRVLLSIPPLSRADAETKGWLGNLIHELWLARYGVRDLLAETSKHHSDLNTKYSQLKVAFHKSPDLRDAIGNSVVRDLIVRFRNGCLALAKTIEKFPSTVRVT